MKRKLLVVLLAMTMVCTPQMMTFASVAETDVEVMDLEEYEYWEEYNWGVPPKENSDMNVEGTWICASDGRWWYQHTDGTYMTNGWERINEKWYRFDESGWMQTGWVQDYVNFDAYWYYLGEDGAMLTGWFLDGNTWYYLNTDGKMATGWILDGNTWYYLNQNGAMACNETLVINGIEYSFNESGAWYK